VSTPTLDRAAPPVDHSVPQLERPATAPPPPPPAGAGSVPGPAPSPQQVRTGISPRRAVGVLAVLGLGFVIWAVLFSSLPQARKQLGLERQLRSELTQGLAPVNQPIPLGAPIARLQIPAIGVDEVVVEGTEARQLTAGPGHLRSSVLPGQQGVSVILGRRVTHGAPFARVHQLAEGDRIRVTTGQGTTTYRVRDVRVRAAEDAAAFVADPRSLLLVTAHRSPLSTERVVVRADAVGDLFPAGSRDGRGPVTGVELGTEGDATAAVGILVWTQLLVLAGAGAVVLQRRWGRQAAWLLAGPVAVAALWGLYEHLGLLLPAAY
jgi:sortase A